MYTEGEREQNRARRKKGRITISGKSTLNRVF
jgi:hypothetical protein